MRENSAVASSENRQRQGQRCQERAPGSDVVQFRNCIHITLEHHSGVYRSTPDSNLEGHEHGAKGDGNLSGLGQIGGPSKYCRHVDPDTRSVDEAANGGDHFILC